MTNQQRHLLPALNLHFLPPLLDDNILKTGVLKEGRKGGKKFFVVRQDGYNNPARIDCYNSVKYFQTGSKPKISLKLKDVFSINKTIISKDNVYGIGMFGCDKTVYLGCENSAEQDAWLYVLNSVYRSCKAGTKDEDYCTTYDYVWDVKVLRKGLASPTNPFKSGQYCLCFNDCSIFLWKKTEEQPTLLELPLVCISNFGVTTDHTLYLRVGRSAVTGPGEIWIEHEQAVVLDDIHATLSKILMENCEMRMRNKSPSVKNFFTFENSTVKSKLTPRTTNDLPKNRPLHNSFSFSGVSPRYDDPPLMTPFLSSSPSNYYKILHHQQPNLHLTTNCQVSVVNISHEPIIDTDPVDTMQNVQNQDAPISHCSKEIAVHKENNTDSYVLMSPLLKNDSKMKSINEDKYFRSVAKTPPSSNRTVHELGRIDEYMPMAPADPNAECAKKVYNLEDVKSYIKMDDEPSLVKNLTDFQLAVARRLNCGPGVSDSYSDCSLQTCKLPNWSNPVGTNQQQQQIKKQKQEGQQQTSPPTPVTPASSTSSFSSFASFIHKISHAGSDLRRRAYSFGSWSRKLKRKRSGTSIEQPDCDDFRQRSESFGSRRSNTTYSTPSLNQTYTPASIFSATQLSAASRRCSNISDDFLEVDFGPAGAAASSFNRKGAPKFGGSSPTCSAEGGTATVTPSAKFVEDMLAQYAKLKAGTEHKEKEKSSLGEYMVMNCNRASVSSHQLAKKDDDVIASSAIDLERRCSIKSDESLPSSKSSSSVFTHSNDSLNSLPKISDGQVLVHVDVHPTSCNLDLKVISAEVIDHKDDSSKWPINKGDFCETEHSSTSHTNFCPDSTAVLQNNDEIDAGCLIEESRGDFSVNNDQLSIAAAAATGLQQFFTSGLQNQTAIVGSPVNNDEPSPVNAGFGPARAATFMATVLAAN